MVAAHLTGVVLTHLHTAAMFVLQEGGDSGNDPLSIWRQMGWIAKTVVVILFIMSGWSIGVMIDRWMAFSAARKQSRAFAPAVAGALREGLCRSGERAAAAHVLPIGRRHDQRHQQARARGVEPDLRGAAGLEGRSGNRPLH